MISSTEPPGSPLGIGAPIGSPISGAHIVEAAEWQTRRMAREIHDTVGGALTVARMVVDRVKRENGSEGAVEAALTVLDLAIRDVRTLLREVDLRPLDDGGLVAALRRLLSSYAAMGVFAGRVRRHPLESDLPRVVEVTAFRIAQEALTNVARHAQARFVEIDVRQRRHAIELTITDDGCGFDANADPGDPRRDDRLGIRGMRERAQMLGGFLEVRSQPEIGTVIRAMIPIPVAAQAVAIRPSLEPVG
jgi:two-component system sensor histidine kinase UhpB